MIDSGLQQVAFEGFTFRCVLPFLLSRQPLLPPTSVSVRFEVADMDYGRVFIYDVASASKRELNVLSTKVNAIAISPDDTRILTGAESSWLRVWDIASGVALVEFPESGSYIPDVAWDPKDRFLAAAGGYDHCVLAYRCEDVPHTLARALVNQLHEEYGTAREAVRRIEHMDLGQFKEMFPDLGDEQVRTLREESLRMALAFGDDPDHLNSIAWGAVFDAGSAEKEDLCLRALDLARNALEQRDSWEYHRTSGLAYYRLGRFQQAEVELERASEQPGPLDRPQTRLLLAMARFQVTDGRLDPMERRQRLQEEIHAITSGVGSDPGTYDLVTGWLVREAQALTGGSGTR